jgi:hypothetical protein
LLSIAGNAQVTIKQNKQDNDLKLSALPYYSFGKGINSLLQTVYTNDIRFRMQNELLILK